MQIPDSINKFFPFYNISNIARFYLLTAFNNMWFLSGNWIFYWLRFMNYGQLGIMDATCFLFGLIMEVPSGAVADVLGKKKTISLGMFLSGLGFLFMGTASSLTPLWIGFLLAQAGWSFYSGAAEAMAYDTLVDNKREDEFEKVITTSGSIATITTVLATITGGLMYTLYWRSTHLGMSVAYFIAFLLALGLTEPKSDTEKFSLQTWWGTVVEGSKQLLIPSLKPFVIVILVLMGTEYMYEWGLLKPAIATSFGFLDKAQAILFAAFGIINSILVRYIPKIRLLWGDEKGLFYLTLMMGAGFIIASLPLSYVGLLPMLTIAISGYLVFPWISIIVNKEIMPKHRATTLSAIALLTKIPYVLIAMIAGKLIDGGMLWLFNLTIGLIVIGSMMVNRMVSFRITHR